MTETRPQVGMLLYPGLTLLDLQGPLEALAPVADVRLCWKNLDPVKSDGVTSVLPTTTFDDCPADLDVLFCPGGIGMLEMVSDDEVLDFLADRGARATWVTSVCTGSLVIGAAGLLEGYRASCHWAGHHLLPLVGAVPAEGRVVKDRNRITGGGITAGIDFGLEVIAELLGEDVARRQQLYLEYDPHPPFDAGTPSSPQTDPRAVQQLEAALAPLNAAMETALGEHARLAGRSVAR